MKTLMQAYLVITLLLLILLLIIILLLLLMPLPHHQHLTIMKNLNRHDGSRLVFLFF